jgi:hypothetical protein
MSKISLTPNASGTGTLTIAAPNTSTDRTLTLPDETGTIISSTSSQVAGPAFSAYGSTLTSVPNNTWTKIIFNTENFDTNNCFDTSNYRFTPNVAGHYQFNCRVGMGATGTGIAAIKIYKNGSQHIIGDEPLNIATYGAYPSVHGLGWANGTTDYFEVYVYQNSGSTQNCGSAQSGFNFDGFLARIS